MNRQRLTRAFTLMELMTVLTIIAILATLATSFFANYTKRAKTSEAIVGVSKMAEGEVSYWSKNGAFTNAGPTNIPPSSNKTLVDFQASDPNWQLISFGFAEPVYYGYQATITSPTAVDCEAFGDLNGDGILSTFRRSVTAPSAGGAATALPLVYFDEIE